MSNYMKLEDALSCFQYVSAEVGGNTHPTISHHHRCVDITTHSCNFCTQTSPPHMLVLFFKTRKEQWAVPIGLALECNALDPVGEHDPPADRRGEDSAGIVHEVWVTLAFLSSRLDCFSFLNCFSKTLEKLLLLLTATRIIEKTKKRQGGGVAVMERSQCEETH